MKIKLSDIKSGFQNKFLDIPTGSIPKRGTTFKSDNIKCTLSAGVSVKNRFKLSGEIETDIFYECVRCLDAFETNISLPLDISFKSNNIEESLKSESENMIKFSDSVDEIDIGILLADFIELEKPINPLCANECQGLCTICGINKNDIFCDCKIEKGYGLWENLKKLETKEH